MAIDLRLAGYDVVSIMEQMAGADDETVIDFARSAIHHCQNGTETLSRTLSTSTRALGELLHQHVAAGSGPTEAIHSAENSSRNLSFPTPNSHGCQPRKHP